MNFAEKIRKYFQHIANLEENEDACDLNHPPLTREQIENVEKIVGFSIPNSLRSLYEEVGNGGYGPAYGLLGLVGGAKQEDGNGVVAVYQDFLESVEDDPHWNWPEGLLPVVHLGCGMFFCVDASTRDGMVIWFEPNPHVEGEPWADAYFPLGVTFESMMLFWVGGQSIDSLMEDAWNRAANE